jgi:LysM repeat protein
MLGLVDDPTTSALYVREDHRCNLPGVPAPDANWQERYCLSGRHDQCPFYRAHAFGEPTKKPSTSSRHSLVWIAMSGFAILVVLTGLLLATRWGTEDAGAGAEVSQRVDHPSPTVAVIADRPTPTVPLLVGSPTSSPHITPISSTQSTAAEPPTTPTVAPTPTIAPTPTMAPTPTPTPATPTEQPTAPPTPQATDAAAPTPPPTPERTHVVVSGETLGEIASQYGVTVQQIVDLNQIQDPNHIEPGTTLRIPPA